MDIAGEDGNEMKKNLFTSNNWWILEYLSSSQLGVAGSMGTVGNGWAVLVVPRLGSTWGI